MKKNGFTFIEVLVAIVVFSIGVFAVLGLLTSNLKGMDRNDLRLQGTLLAKEGLELVYNMRDSNLEREIPWNCILDSQLYKVVSSGVSNTVSYWFSDNSNVDEFRNICSGYFNSVPALQISYSADNYIVANRTSEGFSGNQLYMHTGDNGLIGYSHENNNDELTVFSRYITFTGITEEIPGNNKEKNLLDTGKILKVSSHVLWQRGSTTGEVVLDSFIGNY